MHKKDYIRRVFLGVGVLGAAAHAAQHVFIGSYALMNVINNNFQAGHTHPHTHENAHFHDHLDSSILDQIVNHPLVNYAMIALVPMMVWEGIHHYKTHKKQHSLLDENVRLKQQISDLEQQVRDYNSF